MTDWVSTLASWDAEGRACVVVTVVRAKGSTPREAGAKMLVAADALAGTIGGGNLEHVATTVAREMLSEGRTGAELREFPLGPALSQCCGGHATLLFEPVAPPARQVALFGAGHVGQAVAKLLSDLPCRLRWIDSRDGLFPEPARPHMRYDRIERPEREVAGLASGTHVVVMTHNHALDYAIVAAAMARTDLGLLGVIGSKTKAARFRSRLARDGFAPERIAAMECPVGLPDIGGKLPAEVAISVVARLLSDRVRAPEKLIADCADCVSGCGTLRA